MAYGCAGFFFNEAKETERISNECEEVKRNFQITGEPDLKDIEYPANDGDDTMRFLALQLSEITHEPFSYVWNNMDIIDYYRFSVDSHFKKYCDWQYLERKKK